MQNFSTWWLLYSTTSGGLYEANVINLIVSSKLVMSIVSMRIGKSRPNVVLVSTRPRSVSASSASPGVLVSRITDLNLSVLECFSRKERLSYKNTRTKLVSINKLQLKIKNKFSFYTLSLNYEIKLELLNKTYTKQYTKGNLFRPT